MKVLSAEFEKSVFSPKAFPKPDLPEIAFAGRSNVGKSSLINTLVHRKQLVKVSGTPGKTTCINFFRINGKLRFVDLPGYGYARVPREVQKRWKPLIEGYMLHRPTLVSVVFILDIRRDVAEGDLALWEWLLETTREIIPVCTKADKVSFGEMTERVSHVTKSLGEDISPIPFSSKTGMGKGALWSRIQRSMQSIDRLSGPTASFLP